MHLLRKLQSFLPLPVFHVNIREADNSGTRQVTLLLSEPHELSFILGLAVSLLDLWRGWKEPFPLTYPLTSTHCSFVC
jgi:hypothetical protein